MVTADFIEYWSAYRALITCGNPYDALCLREIQQSVGYAASQPLMMWNPPWLLTMLAPILRLDLVPAECVFLLLSALIWIGGFLIVAAQLQVSYLMRMVLLVPASMVMMINLYFGQLGALSFLAVVLLLVRPERRSLMICCRIASLMLMSVKPHLWLAGAPLIFMWLQRERLLLASVGSAFVALCAFLGLGTGPQSLLYWIHAVVDPQAEPWVIPVHRYVTTVPSSGLLELTRNEFAKFGWSAEALEASWPLYLFVPLAALFLARVSGGILKARMNHATAVLPLSLPVMFAAAPFGWIFDFSAMALLLLVVFKWLQEEGTDEAQVLFWLCAIAQLAVVSQFQFVSINLTYLVWYPVIMAIIGGRMLLLLRRRNLSSR